MKTVIDSLLVENFKIPQNNYSFEVYSKDDLVSRVFVKGTTVLFENFTDIAILLPFGVQKSATLEDLDEFFEERCFPKDRVNCNDILKRLDVPYYEPELICRKTHGLQWDDFIWIKFENENISYNDIKLRD